jgi:hypothetical protein|tara:strand:+ start:25 stop:201 length:177 start_codon:yes stop_codon:yes gene_type:complete
MVYRNKCTICGLEEDEHRALADYDKPSPCIACGSETKNVVDGVRVKPFKDGPNNGRMK